MTIKEIINIIMECRCKIDDDELKQKLKKVILELMKIEAFFKKYSRNK